MTASRIFNSNMNISAIDETRGNITVEKYDLLVIERNPDRERDVHHFIVVEQPLGVKQNEKKLDCHR